MKKIICMFLTLLLSVVVSRVMRKFNLQTPAE